jgi:putative oxidoreductase
MLSCCCGSALEASLFLPSGVIKLMEFSAFAASLGPKGVPYPEAWAAAAVAIEVLGPTALIAGVFPRGTAVLLIAFVVMASATYHRCWEFTEAAARRGKKANRVGARPERELSSPGKPCGAK